MTAEKRDFTSAQERIADLKAADEVSTADAKEVRRTPRDGPLALVELEPSVREFASSVLSASRRYSRSMKPLALHAQELPFDHPDSTKMFRSTPENPFVATQAAIEMYQQETIMQCLQVLQQKATEQNGLDSLQVFEDESKPR